MITATTTPVLTQPADPGGVTEGSLGSKTPGKQHLPAQPPYPAKTSIVNSINDQLTISPLTD